MVSVILSTYNQQKYLAEAIESVIAQTYKDWELFIFMDDNSEETENIIQRYTNNNIFYCKSRDVGLSKTRNLGTLDSSGAFLVYVDGDDVLSPTYLKKAVRVMMDNPDAKFVYPDTNLINADGKIQGYWESPEYNFYSLLENNYIVSSSMIRRWVVEDIGGFDENNFGYFEDYFFWIRAGSLGYYGVHLPEKLFNYRVHSESGMQSERNKKLGGIYKVYIISKFPELYPRNWGKEANEILSRYPDDFMSWKPQQQIEWVKEQ